MLKKYFSETIFKKHFKMFIPIRKLDAWIVYGNEWKQCMDFMYGVGMEDAVNHTLDFSFTQHLYM